MAKNAKLKQLLKPYLKLQKDNVNWKTRERPEKFNTFNMRQKARADFIWKLICLWHKSYIDRAAAITAVLILYFTLESSLLLHYHSTRSDNKCGFGQSLLSPRRRGCQVPRKPPLLVLSHRLACSRSQKMAFKLLYPAFTSSSHFCKLFLFLTGNSLWGRTLDFWISYDFFFLIHQEPGCFSKLNMYIYTEK